MIIDLLLVQRAESCRELFMIGVKRVSIELSIKMTEGSEGKCECVCVWWWFLLKCNELAILEFFYLEILKYINKLYIFMLSVLFCVCVGVLLESASYCICVFVCVCDTLYRCLEHMFLTVTCVCWCFCTLHTLSIHIGQDHAMSDDSLLSLKYHSSSSPLNPPPLPLRPPTFPDVPVCRALKLPGTQQEAGPVMWVALAAGGGAEAPGGRAALVTKDLVDGGAVLIGQGSCTGRCITVLLGVWEMKRWRGVGKCGVTVEFKKKEWWGWILIF